MYRSECYEGGVTGFNSAMIQRGLFDEVKVFKKSGYVYLKISECASAQRLTS